MVKMRMPLVQLNTLFSFSNLKRILLSSVICINFVAISAIASTYYVSPLGDNNNSGLTETTSFKTVQYAIDKMKSKDILIVLDGHYLEELTIKSGITIKAKNPRNVLFSSLKEITDNFIPHTDKIYKVALGANTKMIFYNGFPMTWARWPNASWEENNIEDKKWAFATDGTGPGVLTSKNFHEISSLNLVGGYCNIRYGKGNSCYTRAIESFDGTTLHWNDENFYDAKYTGEDGPKGSPKALLKLSADHKHHPNKSRFFLTGSLDLLDSKTEWYVKNDTLYFITPNGENPNNGSVLYKAFDYCINVKSTITDFTIDGIDFSGCTIKLSNPNNRNIKIINSHFKYPDANEVYTDRVIGNEIIKPVRIYGTDISVDNCLFFGSFYVGLYLKGSKLLVNNSVFLENNRNAIFPCRSLMIYLKGTEGFTITNNTFINNGSDAILISQKMEGEPPIIAYNHIFNGAKYNADVSGIYMPTMTQNFMEIHHNWIHNINGNAIRLDKGGKELNIHHNVLWGSDRGLNIEGYSDFNIYNNTSALNENSDRFCRNVVQYFDEYPINVDSTFPPINDWNILNNVSKGMSDNILDGEMYIYNERKAANLPIHKKREDEPNIPLDNDGNVQGNYIIDSITSIFTSTEPVSLNLFPLDHDSLKTSMISQTNTLADEGVHYLNTFKGAYDINDSYWSPGSKWMPENLPVLKTMADANNFALEHDTISLMFRVIIPEASQAQTSISLKNNIVKPISMILNKGLLHFNNLKKDTKVEVLNINGRVISSHLYNGSPISLNGISKGIYLVRTKDQLFIQKIAKY